MLILAGGGGVVLKHTARTPQGARILGYVCQNWIVALIGTGASPKYLKNHILASSRELDGAALSTHQRLKRNAGVAVGLATNTQARGRSYGKKARFANRTLLQLRTISPLDHFVRRFLRWTRRILLKTAQQEHRFLARPLSECKATKIPASSLSREGNNGAQRRYFSFLRPLLVVAILDRHQWTLLPFREARYRCAKFAHIELSEVADQPP